MIVCKLFDRYEREIQNYCLANSLDFEKVRRSVKNCGKDDIWLQHFDPEKGKMGLLDETPAPITLIIKINNGKLTFEQTEYTKKYLT